jgi:hypothetical protein
MKHNLRNKFHFAAYLTQFVWRIFSCYAVYLVWKILPPPRGVVMMLSLDLRQPGECDGGLQRDERPGVRFHVHPGRSGGRSILPQEEGPRHRQPHSTYLLAREY